jgi:hypothetical protein
MLSYLNRYLSTYALIVCKIELKESRFDMKYYRALNEIKPFKQVFNLVNVSIVFYHVSFKARLSLARISSKCNMHMPYQESLQFSKDIETGNSFKNILYSMLHGIILVA